MSMFERFFRRKSPDKKLKTIDIVIKDAEKLMRTLTQIDRDRTSYVYDVQTIRSRTSFEEAIKRQHNLELFEHRAVIEERTAREELLKD